MAIDYRALGRKGGLAFAATHDTHAQAAVARESAPSNIETWIAKQPADLAPDERERRARAAQRLHFTRLAEKSAAARKQRAQ
jgi:hypothetical protein